MCSYFMSVLFHTFTKELIENYLFVNYVQLAATSAAHVLFLVQSLSPKLHASRRLSLYTGAHGMAYTEVNKQANTHSSIMSTSVLYVS